MVTVWRVPLDQSALFSRTRLQSLDADESRRATAFVDALQGRRWAVTHAVLREILGAELGIAPASVRFRRSINGHVTLDQAGALVFSLSHCADLALIAVSERQAIGVDVERTREILGRADVLRDVFTQREREAIAALDESEVPLAFLRGWTRKEAVVKALGQGIEAMRLVEVTVGEDAALVHFARLDGAPDDWTLHDLGLGVPHVGALAVRETGARYRLREWVMR